MTDNEIKKALECCSEQKCWECPFEPVEHPKKTFGCSDEMMLKSFNLINRLQAEIEDLKKVVVDDYASEYDNKIKAEAHKEFVEGLKERLEYFPLEKESFVSEEQIDNLLKEKVGEDK